MKVCVELSPDENKQLETLALKLFGRVHGGKNAIIHAALIEYLDRNSMAPPMHEKKSEKRKIPPNRQPLEVRDPDLAQKIVAYYGAGKRSGGHSRSETAKEFGLGEGQIDKIIRRAR